MKTVVLVVADHKISIEVCKALDPNFYQLDFSIGAPDAAIRVSESSYDCVIAGTSFVDKGEAICNAVRHSRDGTTPIMMLSTDSSLSSKLAAFKGGCDDYVVLPITPLELEARTQALSRRRHRKKICVEHSLHGVSINVLQHKVSRNGMPVTISPKCFDILSYLMACHPSVVSSSELINAVWGGKSGCNDTLRAHMHLLRQSLSQPGHSNLVHTLRNRGYRFCNKMEL